MLVRILLPQFHHPVVQHRKRDIVNKKILVVDKDQLVLYGLSKALSHEAYDIETAHSASTAIEKLVSCPYDLCLLDMFLPDSSGMELMRFIRNTCPKSKIVIMTASNIDFPELSGYVDEATKTGACHFILKPFTLCEITDTLGNLLKEEGNFHTGLRFTGSAFVKKTRRSERRPYSDSIIFQMTVIDQGTTKRYDFEAKSTDINDDGIGLLTKFPLKVSQIIGFNEGLNNKRGIVIWSTMLENQTCRSGIRFA